MLKIQFKTDNAAFDDEPATEAARILRRIADDIERGYFVDGAPIRDLNGNRIGEWSLDLPDDWECAREGGHQNDGDDVCARCGEHLN